MDEKNNKHSENKEESKPKQEKKTRERSRRKGILKLKEDFETNNITLLEPTKKTSKVKKESKKSYYLQRRKFYISVQLIKENLVKFKL